ncbi:MAG: hypothetical protein PHX18_05010 [Candidatus Gastranaerophilales bacterium]|nr:hypothetical protein [Candidatus Gastranaerophilales bacterium]
MSISDTSFLTMLNAIKKTNIFTTNKTQNAKSTTAAANSQSLFTQKDEEESTTKPTQSMAEMSSSDFIKYVYNNNQSIANNVTATASKASTGEGTSQEVLDSRKEDGVQLPRLVRYKAQVVLTTGKTLDEVVAAIKKKSPASSEIAIKAELKQKYPAASGGNLNMNA